MIAIKRARFIILAIAVSYLFLSCTALTAVKTLRSEDATANVWANDEDKIVLFFPMVHIGKAALYADIKSMIEDGKKQGFVVYYEGVTDFACVDSIGNSWKEKNYVKQFYKGSPVPDSVCYDTYRRKFRKMIGLSIDSGYAKIFHDRGLFRNYVDQADALVLEADSTNINVDLSRSEIVDAYEKLYGEIELTESDYQVKSDITLQKDARLPRSKVNSIIIDVRNKHLANHIQSSPDKRIIVVYGLAHEKGVFEELRKMDNSWQYEKD